MHRRCRELAKGRLCEDLFRVHYVDLIKILVEISKSLSLCGSLEVLAE